MGWPGAGADATATIGGAGGMALHVQRRQDPAEEATLTMPEMLSSFGSEFWMKNQLFRVTFVGFASLHIFICNKYFKSLYQLLHCKYTANIWSVMVTGFYCVHVSAVFVLITGNFRTEILCKIMDSKSLAASYGNGCVENQHYIRVLQAVAS